MLDTVRGVNDALPVVVGALRGLAEAVVFGGLAAGAVFLTDFDFTVVGVDENLIPLIVPAIIFGLRTVEGYADQIDPAKQRSKANEALPDPPRDPENIG